MLCVPIYNIKLAMMQKTLIFITFSAHTKMADDKRGQIEVFARIITFIHIHALKGGTVPRGQISKTIFPYFGLKVLTQ